MNPKWYTVTRLAVCAAMLGVVHAAEVDWYGFFTVEVYEGKSAKVKAARANEEAFAQGGEAKLVKLEVYELGSIWKK